MQRLSIPRIQNGAARLLASADDSHVAIVCRDEHIGYGALRDAVARTAAVWRAHGLQPGGRVAVCLPDGIEWAVAWLGAVWAGGVAVGVNPRLTPQEWQGLLESSGFDLVVTDTPPDLTPDAAADVTTDTPPAWRSRCTRALSVPSTRAMLPLTVSCSAQAASTTDRPSGSARCFGARCAVTAWASLWPTTILPGWPSRAARRPPGP